MSLIINAPKELCKTISSNTISSFTSDEPIPSTSSSLSDEPLKLKHERKCSSDDGIHYVDDDDGIEFALDARQLNQVHEELEKLNIATDVINSLELQLDESRIHFHQIHTKWQQRLEEMAKKYGNAIQKSRPYYEAITEEQELRSEAQEAVSRFQRATSRLQISKDQVRFTQDSLSRQKIIEPDCLEELNRHIQRVSDAEQERQLAEEHHKIISQRLLIVTTRIHKLEKEFAKSIKKSRYYFSQREEFRRVMDHQKEMIRLLEIEVKQKKSDYTTSLTNLEAISNSIHEERSLSSMKRINGIGISGTVSSSALGST